MGNFAENLNLGNRFRPPLHLLFRPVITVIKQMLSFVIYMTVFHSHVGKRARVHKSLL